MPPSGNRATRREMNAQLPKSVQLFKSLIQITLKSAPEGCLALVTKKFSQIVRHPVLKATRYQQLQENKV